MAWRWDWLKTHLAFLENQLAKAEAAAQSTPAPIPSSTPQSSPAPSASSVEAPASARKHRRLATTNPLVDIGHPLFPSLCTLLFGHYCAHLFLRLVAIICTMPYEVTVFFVESVTRAAVRRSRSHAAPTAAAPVTPAQPPSEAPRTSSPQKTAEAAHEEEEDIEIELMEGTPEPPGTAPCEILRGRKKKKWR